MGCSFMRSWRATCETINLTATGLWLGSLVMTGVTAALLFPIVKSQTPMLPKFALYTGEHWRIAAGQPADKIFVACDAIQFMCAMVAAVALATMVFVTKVRVRRPAMLIRIAALVFAFILLGTRFFFLQPWMDTHLHAFWEAAEKGDTVVAEQFRAKFDADHPIASNMLAATAFCVLLAMVFGAWCAATPEAGDTRKKVGGSTTLETPMLARTLGR